MKARGKSHLCLKWKPIKRSISYSTEIKECNKKLEILRINSVPQPKLFDHWKQRPQLLKKHYKNYLENLIMPIVKKIDQ